MENVAATNLFPFCLLLPCLAVFTHNALCVHVARLRVSIVLPATHFRPLSPPPSQRFSPGPIVNWPRTTSESWREEWAREQEQQSVKLS